MIDVLGRLYDPDHLFDSTADLKADLGIVSMLTEPEIEQAARTIGLAPGVVRGLVEASRLADRALATLRGRKLDPSVHNLIMLLRQSEHSGEEELRAGAWFVLHKVRGGGAALHELRRRKG